MIDLERFYEDIEYRWNHIVKVCEIKHVVDNFYDMFLFGHSMGRIEKKIYFDSAPEAEYYDYYTDDTYYKRFVRSEFRYFLSIYAESIGILPHQQRCIDGEVVYNYSHEYLRIQPTKFKSKPLFWRTPPGSSNKVLSWPFALAPKGITICQKELIVLRRWCRDTFGTRRGKRWNNVGSTMVFQESVDVVVFQLYWQNRKIIDG